MNASPPGIPMWNPSWGNPPWGTPHGESPMGESPMGNPPWGIHHGGIPHGGNPPWGIPHGGTPHGESPMRESPMGNPSWKRDGNFYFPSQLELSSLTPLGDFFGTGELIREGEVTLLSFPGLLGGHAGCAGLRGSLIIYHIIYHYI